ncbi:hypothetical protein [Aliarcobacter butzleri]|uniref:hypothetical protein n=1 Tax=Aliarcobacter butzleri TaxID=28197 RepID=UPI00263C1970|nr:hypothetical protein [Aliarcobacter butzleri]MDN5082007.1 hypothetical protein [Aliarcobacter butzleri]MDN5084317.1 hypothetical protein [Aliarcobacter butzleri]
MKYDIRKHDFKTLIKKSEEYKEYINSKEILDLEMAIDRELLNLERSAKAFKILAYELKNDLIKPKNKEKEKETLKIENIKKETLNENTNFKNEIENLDKVFENIKENIEYYQSFDR